MGIKITKIIASAIILGAMCCTCNFTKADEVVRVGITDQKFQNVLRKNSVTLYGTSDCEIYDNESKKFITKINANETILINNLPYGLGVTIGENTYVFKDFVITCPIGVIGIKDLTRKGKPALYHGAFEVIQNDKKTGFYLVNLIELQEYLKGVVPNEMPTRFGLEALKAQAVAARNYVLTPRTQAYKEFNVVDSVASQVYYGVNTEEDLSTRAVMETEGVVALYNNDLILTLYSSTAGGHTESYSNAFSDVNTKAFPAENKPYLKGVADNEEFKNLDNEKNVIEFYKDKVPSYDIESPYYRWKREWTSRELDEILKTTLVAQSKTGFVHPAVNPEDNIGKIKDIKVMKRGVSGKAMEVEIMTTKGCYRIYKELVIRRVFQKEGISLPSANIFIEKELDSYGNVLKFYILGGGFGHGVGMSQYGAGFMATKLNQPYYNILRHYYTDINLGTKPITVCGEEVVQTFWAPIGRANIVVTNSNAPKVAVKINGKLLELPIMKTMFQKDYKIDISRYIEDGKNTILIYPPSLGRSVSMYIELVEKYGNTTSEDDEERNN